MRDWKVLFFHPGGPTLKELIVQAFSSTQKGYDLLAEKFDYTPYRTPDEILNVMAIEFEKMPPCDAALDICCGTGAMTKVLLLRCKKRMVGFDLSEGMMRVAKEKLKDHDKAHLLEFIQGDALHLPFDNEFDIVINFGGLGHIMRKDVPGFVAQAYKALCPGGRFMFVTSTYPSVFSSGFWRANSFNLLIHIRNALFKPPFIMYYLAFCLPKIRNILEAAGFEVEIKSRLFSKPFDGYKLVIALKKAKED